MCPSSRSAGRSGTADLPHRVCSANMALDLAQWRIFLVAAERGSLIKAAEVLHTDQPALSRALRRLEHLVGAPLFDRSSRGLTLTELGRRLREPVRDLVAHAETVELQARADARQASGVLRVGAIDTYPMTVAIAAACRDLIVGDTAVIAEVVALPWLAHPRAVRDRTIDIGFTLTVDGRLPDPKTMRSQLLWEEHETFALISERHPLANTDGRIDPVELGDIPLHLPDKDDNTDIYNLILEQLADAGLPAPRRAPPVGSFANVLAPHRHRRRMVDEHRHARQARPPGDRGQGTRRVHSARREVGGRVARTHPPRHRRRVHQTNPNCARRPFLKQRPISPRSVLGRNEHAVHPTAGYSTAAVGCLDDRRIGSSAWNRAVRAA